MHNSLNTIYEDVPSSMSLCKLWDLRQKLRRQLMRMAAHTVWWHIFDNRKMTVPWEHYDKVDAWKQIRLPANCRSRMKTRRKNGVVYRKLSNSLYHIFTHPYRGICVMLASNECPEMTDNIKYKLTKRCARMHVVQRVRGCAGATKQKNTHMHMHGESEEDGVWATVCVALGNS